MSEIMRLESVERRFRQRGRDVHAILPLDLELQTGEVLALVGESGCGKTTTGRMLAGLLPPSAGRVLFRGQDIAKLRGATYKHYRLAVQLIHQDPYAALNPSQTVFSALSTPLLHHRMVSRTALLERVEALLESVDLPSSPDFFAKYPHQLSGGQRQRLLLARALTVQPEVLIADEAVSMVDVSIRISLLQTLANLRAKQNLTLVFITHDLAVARHVAENGRIGVMYLGQIVELGAAQDVIAAPQHPYTQALIAASPPDPRLLRRAEPLKLRSQDIPSLLERPSGCAFHPRCPQFIPNRCELQEPKLSNQAHAVACFAREVNHAAA